MPAASDRALGRTSSRNSSAPPWRASRDSRWARTSCISPAIRRRSASRARVTRSRSSVSARWARSFSDHTNSRWPRTNSPHPIARAVSITPTDTCHAAPRPSGPSGCSNANTTVATTDNAAIAASRRHGARIAALKTAGSGAMAASPDTDDSATTSTATDAGWFRRAHSAEHATTPRVTSRIRPESECSPHVDLRT